MHMEQILCWCKVNGKVFYSAVDSIHCDNDVAHWLLKSAYVGNSLGQLRIKHNAPSASYRGIGDYTVGNSVTRSGLPADAAQACYFCRTNIGMHQGECACCKRPWDGQTWSYMQSESASEIIDHGPSLGLLSRETLISLPSSYRFARVGVDGWTIPYRLGVDYGPEVPTAECGD